MSSPRMQDVVVDANVDSPIAVATRFFHYLDRQDVRRAVGLFTADAVFVRMGRRLVGPEEILQALSDRDENRLVRHFVFNPVVDYGADSSAEVRYDALTLLHRLAAEPEAKAPPFPGFRSLMDCTDTLTRLDGTWRIKEKVYTVVLRSD
jgi:SnoaL-like domain